MVLSPKFFKYSAYFVLGASIVTNLGLVSVIHPQLTAGCWFIFILILVAALVACSFLAYKEQQIHYGTLSFSAKLPLIAIIVVIVLLFFYGISLAF
jgi:hypothetical protein